MHQSVMVIGLISCAAFLVTGAEYYLIFINPELVLLIPEKGLVLCQKLFPITRIFAPVLYILCLLIFAMDPTKKRKRKPKMQSFGYTIAALIGLGISILYMTSISLFPMSWGMYLYPTALMLCIGCGPVLVNGMTPSSNWGIKSPKRKRRTKLGFHLRLKNGWINITNPFRGILVIGSAGAGKSYSVAEPLIEQAGEKNYTGILYDFKFPTLTEHAYTAFHYAQEEITFYVLNFEDLTRSHRVNPLKPENIPAISYAEEYAQALMANLLPESIQFKDFWIRSATAILTATIWYMKKHHPRFCTLPHIISMICSKDYEKLVALLECETETSGLIASLAVAIAKESDKQIAGVMGSVQIALARLDNPAIAWVMSGDDFNLDLNNPHDKKFLCLGTSPTLAEALSPVISCIITVALKLMNKPHQHHSMILLDEAPTLYIPKFDQIPATARSNKIATAFMAQDISQMVQAYGQINAEVILGNLNTQLFGRVSNPRTAEYVSSIFGKEDKEVPNYNQSMNASGSAHAQRMGRSVSYQLKETMLLKPQEVMELEVGEFVGITVDKPNEQFMGKVMRPRPLAPTPLPAFASGIEVEQNFLKIRREAQAILNRPM